MKAKKAAYTLIFLAGGDDIEAAKANKAPLLELTYNWDPEEYSGGRNFGHLAFEVDDIYAFCETLQTKGVTINRPPRERAHGVCSVRQTTFPLNCCKKGEALEIKEPWASMPNTGEW